MKVNELIEELKKLPQDMEVVIDAYADEYPGEAYFKVKSTKIVSLATLHNHIYAFGNPGEFHDNQIEDVVQLSRWERD